MAYWIVYPKDAWEHLVQDGYLWSPKVDRRGQMKTCSALMERVLENDIIFCGYNGALRGSAVVSSPASSAPPLNTGGKNFWCNDGWLLEVRFEAFPHVLPYPELIPSIIRLLPIQGAAFLSRLRPNTGYLYQLPDSAAETILAASQSGILNDDFRS